MSHPNTVASVHVDVLDGRIIDERLKSAQAEKRVEDLLSKPLFLPRVYGLLAGDQALGGDRLQTCHGQLPSELAAVEQAHRTGTRSGQIIGHLGAQARHE
ncbi:MAG TPA: hypothetical protein VGS21_03695 [Acidimicrobiales bacterium]|nr:hypothetical protein [Acidimicrobiales bacterium]